MHGSWKEIIFSGQRWRGSRYKIELINQKEEIFAVNILTWIGIPSGLQMKKKLCLGGPAYMNYYWHDLKREKLQAFRSQKHKQGISIWGGISFTGKTQFAFLDENCNSKKYQEVLNKYLLPQFNENDVLIQDNAPFHVSKCTKQWMNDKKYQHSFFSSMLSGLKPHRKCLGIIGTSYLFTRCSM